VHTPSVRQRDVTRPPILLARPSLAATGPDNKMPSIQKSITNLKTKILA